MSRHICSIAGCHERPTYVWADPSGSVRYVCSEHCLDAKHLPPTVPPAVVAMARESAARAESIEPRRRWVFRRRTA